MKTPLSILILLLLIGCKQEEPIRKVESEAKIETINSEIAESMIIGIWTDGSSENATFEITPASIYYVDHLQEYPYLLKHDTIEIIYPDYTYRAGILLKNDSLIMNSKEFGQAKFWRFKE